MPVPAITADANQPCWTPFSEGDVVKVTDPERIRATGNGSFVFVSPAKCEKVTDPELAEAYRSIIYSGR
jgi:hypothetical protein